MKRLLAMILGGMLTGGPTAGGAAAQAVRVIVRDSAQGQPIPDALVSLLDSAADLVSMRRTGFSGLVWLAPPAAGHYAVRAQKPGFRALVSDWLALGNTDSVEVTFTLARAAVVLSPILVAAQRDSVAPLLPPGINPRAISGRVIVPAEVEAHSMGARDYVDVLMSAGVAGLTVASWRDAAQQERRCIASSRSVSRSLCARVFVNNMLADAQSAIDLATPENLDFAVWLRPEDAGVLYGSARPGEDASVLLLFTKDWRRAHSVPRPPAD